MKSPASGSNAEQVCGPWAGLQGRGTPQAEGEPGCTCLPSSQVTAPGLGFQSVGLCCTLEALTGAQASFPARHSEEGTVLITRLVRVPVKCGWHCGLQADWMTLGTQNI